MSADGSNSAATSSRPTLLASDLVQARRQATDVVRRLGFGVDTNFDAEDTREAACLILESSFRPDESDDPNRLSFSVGFTDPMMRRIYCLMAVHLFNGQSKNAVAKAWRIRHAELAGIIEVPSKWRFGLLETRDSQKIVLAELDTREHMERFALKRVLARMGRSPSASGEYAEIHESSDDNTAVESQDEVTKVAAPPLVVESLNIAHKLIAVMPDSLGPIPDNEIDALVQGALGIPSTSPGRSIFESVVRGAFRVMPMSGLDDLLQMDKIQRDGFATLDDASKRAIYSSTRPVLRALARALLRLHPLSEDALGVRMVRADDPRLAEWRCIDGTFMARQVYAMHPYDRLTYLSLARFHQYLFDEKRAEMVRLMTSLGARSLTLMHTEDDGRAGGVEAGVTGVNGVDVGLKGNAKNSSGSRFALSLTVDERPTRPPSLPTNLVWFHHEPLWQAMANARLEHGVSSFKVTFTYENDFDVDVSLCAKVQGVGLKLGGTFEKNQSVRQEYEVAFWPRQ